MIYYPNLEILFKINPKFEPMLVQFNTKSETRNEKKTNQYFGADKKIYSATV